MAKFVTHSLSGKQVLTVSEDVLRGLSIFLLICCYGLGKAVHGCADYASTYLSAVLSTDPHIEDWYGASFDYLKYVDAGRCPTIF